MSNKIVGTIGKAITYTSFKLSKMIEKSYKLAGNKKPIASDMFIHLQKKLTPNKSCGGITISFECLMMLIEFPYQRDHVKRSASKLVSQALCILREDHCNIVIGVLSDNCSDRYGKTYSKGTVFLIDGHTRRHIWESGKSDFIPRVLNATVHTYATIDEMNEQAYVPANSITAAKKGSDILRSACRKAGFTPRSKSLAEMDWKGVITRLGLHLYDEDYGLEAVKQARRDSGYIKTESSIREDHLADMVAVFRTPLTALDYLDLNHKTKKSGKAQHLWTGATKCALLLFLCRHPHIAELIIENATSGKPASWADDNFHAMFLAMNNNDYPGYDWSDKTRRGADFQLKTKGESQKPIITHIGQEANPAASKDEKVYCESPGGNREQMIYGVPFFLYWMELAYVKGIHHETSKGPKGSSIESGVYSYFVDWMKDKFIEDCQEEFHEWKSYDAIKRKVISI
jgi:hypothetical protein